MLTLKPAPDSLLLEIIGDLPVEPALQTDIDTIWAEVTIELPHLFDGPILTVLAMDGNRLAVARASYRHTLAARRSRTIAERLKLRPLAVSGVLSCPDGLVFGRRSMQVTQGADHWELVPSGGVTPPSTGTVPDLDKQILQELEEEIGLTPAQAAVLPPIAILEDSESGVIDIVLPLMTELSADRIAALHRDLVSHEYAALAIYAPDDSRLDALTLLPETRTIIAALQSSIRETWRSRRQNPA